MVGFTLEEAALILDCDRSKISRIETGQRGIRDEDLRKLLGESGSAGFIAPLGLLIAGISVPSVIMGLLPRPLAWAGLVIAAISMLGSFALLASPLDFTFPIGRFVGLAWIIAVSLMLPASRRGARRGAQPRRTPPAGTPHLTPPTTEPFERHALAIIRGPGVMLPRSLVHRSSALECYRVGTRTVGVPDASI